MSTFHSSKEDAGLKSSTWVLIHEIPSKVTCWGYYSVVQCLHSMHEALASIPSTAKTQKPSSVTEVYENLDIAKLHFSWNDYFRNQRDMYEVTTL